MTAIQNDLDSGGSLNAPSQVIINSFNKIMDASSVVRESEYARTGTGLSLVGQIEGLFTKLVAGGAGVSVKDLQDFVDLSNQLVEGYKQQQLNFAQRVKSQSDTYGLKIENIVTPDVLEMLNDPSLIVTGGGSGGTQSDEDAYQQYLEKTNE